ncbi:MAG TPA: ATP-binding cassette domain-containing protein [Candidatus Bathyarchaeia archaeon]|nr:ATP-binding cassette domain-containing protein [Candidatus Bathyarchaeia archaeon]
MKILEVVGLTCVVNGVALLDALSFTLEEGEILALCGPTDAGKTACLRCLAGSLPATSGRLIFDGREVTGMGPLELARHGLVRTGELPTPPWPLTALQAVVLALRWPRLGAFAAVLAKWPDPRGRARARALLERVGLGAEVAVRRDDLSPDGLERVGLAQALALRPRLLLLDEPLGHLPPDDLRAMAALITEIRAGGVSVVVTEREPSVAEVVADRVAVLDHGALIA